MIDLPKGRQLRCRPAQWSDLLQIVELRNASSRDTRGRDVTAGHWQKRHYYDEEINLATNTQLILLDSQAVAYGEISSGYPHVLYEMIGVVHPAFRNQHLGSHLLRWAENLVMERVKDAPAAAAVFLQNSIFDSNEPGMTLLNAHGYAIVRDFIYLQIFMEVMPQAPQWPEGIEVRLLKEEDWTKAGPALHEAFEDHWGVVIFDGEEPKKTAAPPESSPRQSDPSAFDPAYFNSPGLCFVAWDGHEVAGLCLCNATTVEFPGSGYLGSLSVRRRWRRIGLGRALTLHSLRAFYEQGIRHVITDTDGDGLTKAYRVYEKAGMAAFRREFVFEKQMRSGKDLLLRKMP